jgi:hypothetical protein
MAAAVESLDHWWWSMRIFTWYLQVCPHIPTLKQMVMASIKHVQQALGLSQSLMQIVHKFWTYLALGLGACSCLFWETWDSSFLARTSCLDSLIHVKVQTGFSCSIWYPSFNMDIFIYCLSQISVNFEGSFFLVTFISSMYSWILYPGSYLSQLGFFFFQFYDMENLITFFL